MIFADNDHPAKIITKQSCIRRLILLWLIVLAAIGLPLATPVEAQGNTILSIEPSSANISPGASTTLTVYVTNGSNINAYDVTVLYDASILTLASWSHGTYLTNLATIVNENTPGRLHLVSTQLATPVVSGDGVLLNLVFNGKSQGDSAITLENPQFAGAEGKLIIPSVVHGLVSVIHAIIPSATPTSSPTPTATFTSTLTPTLSSTRTQTKTATITPNVTQFIPIIVLKTATNTPTTVLTGILQNFNTPAREPANNTPLSTQAAVSSELGSPVSSTNDEEQFNSSEISQTKSADQHPDLKSINTLLWVLFFILITILLCAFLLFFFRKKGE